MANKGKGDKVSPPKVEAPKPAAKAIAQNLYQPPKPKAKPESAPKARPAEAAPKAKPAKTRAEVAKPAHGKAKDAPKPAAKRPAEGKSRPAEVKAKPAKPAARQEKQEAAKPKARDKAPKPKATEKAKPQEGLLQRGLTSAMNLYKQVTHAGDSKPQKGKTAGAKAEQSKTGHAKTEQIKPGHAKPGQAKPEQLKPGKAAARAESGVENRAANKPAHTDKTAPRKDLKDAHAKPTAKDKGHEKTARAESKEHQTDKAKQKTDKTNGRADSQLKKEPESGFSLTNLAGKAIETGKKLLLPEAEKPHVNKVENADKLTPQQRKEKGVTDYVDPKTGDKYNYNQDGLLKEVETKSKLKTSYEYKDGKPVNISKTQKVLFLNLAVGSAEAVPGKVALSVDQDSGEARTSRHNVIQQRDEKTNKIRSVEVKQEMVFHTNGEKSSITSNLNGRRLQKEHLSADDKTTGITTYQYGERRPGQSDAPVRAQQTDKSGRVVHNIDFASEKDMKQQKAAAREDIKYERKGAIESEHHETFDLRSGKEVIVNKTDKTTDYKQGSTTVREQQFDKGKLAIDQTVKYDERARAVEMQYKDVQKNVDVQVKFDSNGKSQEVKGNFKNYTDDQSTMKLYMDGQAGRILGQHRVDTIDTGEMLRYCEKSNPREGEKPTGVVSWKTPGEDNLTQATVKDGIVYDADKNKIGRINDRGDLTLNSGAQFNVINDKQYAAMFHGVGTDDHPLNLYGTEGMTGYMSSQGDRVLMVGGNMIDAEGKIIGHMNDDGRMIFAKGVKQDAGTDIKSYMHGGYVFKGNEDGNERRFFVDSISNGQMFVQKTDKNGNQILDANGQPVKPLDCEMRLGMVIDKSSGKQLYNFVPPDVNEDETFSGGFMISMGDSPKMTALSEMKGTSFNVTVLGNQNTYKMVGIATGPQQFQADGTAIKGSGGVVNLDRELKLEKQNFDTRTRALNERLDEEKSMRLKGLGLGTAMLNPAGGLAMADAYNEATGGKAQTEAERTAFDLAKKHYVDQTADINRIITSGQIDNNTLYKLQTGNEKIRQSQLDQLDRMQLLINNPEHKLENVTAKSVDGTIKRPDLDNPGHIVDYEVRANLIYKKGTTNAIGQVNAQDGTMKIYDASGRVEVTKMNDRRLAGTVIHLEGMTDTGEKQSVDWLSDGTGKLQSFAEMRKQAAEQRKFFEVLAGDSGSSQRAKDGLARTIHNEQRFNNTLDDMLKNGVRDVTVDKQGRINPGYNLGKIIEGPRKNVQAEDFLQEEKFPPKKVNVHTFQSQEECNKASGAMRVGKDLYYVEKGTLYHAKTEGGKTVPVGEPVGSLEPGYVAQIGGKRISLQNESQFLFQFKIDGDNQEHRIFGTGAAHIDSTGRFIKGGLVDARELLNGGAEAKASANQAMQEYFDEKPGGNFIADALGWSVNVGLGDREGQMRYVNETIGNQNAAMKMQLDSMFTQGLAEDGMTNNQIDKGVNTANRFMRDLNMSAADMDQMSQEGRNIQKQTSESTAMAMMSLIPGGITFAAGRMGAGSLLATNAAARFGVAVVAGGTISVATRQSNKVDVATAFGTGGLEAGAMFIGAEGTQFLEKLKHVNAASKLGTVEAVKVLGSPEIAPILKDKVGRALVELALKPGGDKVLEGVWRVANAGFQTTALTGASSLREGNFNMMTPDKLLEGGAFMLAADAVTLLAKVPTPGAEWKLQGRVGKFIDGNIKQLAEDSVNNVSNSLMSARVQANEAELENISRERGIPKDLISKEQFEKWKNQSRINSFLVQSVADSVASSLVSAPMNHAMSSATHPQSHAEHLPKDSTTDSPGNSPRSSERDTISGDTVRLDQKRTSEQVEPSKIETPFGYTHITPDGEKITIEPHSGGSYQYNVKDGRIDLVRDTGGNKTRIAYDKQGEVSALHVKNGEHTAVWQKQGDEWVVQTGGIELRSREKISVTEDGRIIHISDNSRQVKNLDGSMLTSDGKGGAETLLNPNLNEDVRLNHVMKLIEHNVTDDVLASRITANINHLMERVIVTGKDRAEFAKTLLHVSDLLLDKPDAKLDKTTRQRLAEEVLWLAANPTYLSQGRHPTCAVAAAEVRQYMEHPSDVVRAIAELANTGQYHCPDGTVLRPFHADGEWIFQPDTDAKVPYEIRKTTGEPGSYDSPRLMASQLWQTLAITGYYNANGFKGDRQLIGKLGYHDEYISDMSKNPPEKVAAYDGPQMNGEMLIKAVHQLTGRTENLALSHKRYEDTEGAHTFRNEREFTSKLLDLHEDGKFPVMFIVDTRNPPWNHGEFGGTHAITILGIETNVSPTDLRNISDILPSRGTTDGASGEVKLPSLKDIEIRIDNQWGKKHDWNLQKITAEDLFIASLNPAEAENIIMMRDGRIPSPRSEKPKGKPDDWHEYGPDQSDKFDIKPHGGMEQTDSVELTNINDRNTRFDQSLAMQNKAANEELKNRKEPDLNLDKVDQPSKEDDKRQSQPLPEESKKFQNQTSEKSKAERFVELSRLMYDQSFSEEKRAVLRAEYDELLRAFYEEHHRASKQFEGDGDQATPPRAADDSSYALAREYKTGKYEEPKLLDVGDTAAIALMNVVDYEYQPWYHDASLRRFVSDMTGAFQNEATLQTAVKKYMESQGLPSPIIEVNDAKLRQLGGTAAYSFADGKLFVRSDMFKPGADFKENLGVLIHELTHTMQDFHIIRLATVEAMRDTKKPLSELDPKEILSRYEKLQGRVLDRAGDPMIWFARAKQVMETPQNAEFVNSKASLSKYAYKNDADIFLAKQLSDSRHPDNDKFSSARRRILEERGAQLVELLGGGRFERAIDLKRHTQRILDGAIGTTVRVSKPLELLSKLHPSNGKQSEDLRRALFGYDPLSEVFTKRNKVPTDIDPNQVSNADQAMEKLLANPEFLEKNPNFINYLINGPQFFWKNMLKSEYPSIEPKGHKSLTRLQLKAMLHAYEHFYKADGTVTEQPLGSLTKNDFDKKIGDALRSQLEQHLAYNEDQKHREYFGNRYEIQPRVATERLHQLMGLRPEKESIESQLRDHIASIHQLQEHVYMDKLVEGTLSEFGFEVKLKEAVDSGREPVSVGFIDLNNFKHINTEFSQKAGDEALQEFGKLAASVLERHGLVAKDCLGHFGGDEYGIVLNGVPLRQAKQIFKEIQALRIVCEEPPSLAEGGSDKSTSVNKERAHRFRVLPDDGSKAPEGTVVVTATLGAVVRRQNQSVEDVLQSADKVMFIVKDKVKQLPEGQSLTKVKAFAGHIERIMGKQISNQLKRHGDVEDIHYSEADKNSRASDFRIQNKTMDEIRQKLDRAENKHQLLTELLTKHRHTGIWNKEISKERLQQQINTNEPFSILRISVDNFKPVNDVFESHAKGNAVLREIGEYLLEVQKRHPNDIQLLGSLGGPAPFMIIKDADKAEEIRKEIDKFFLRVTAEDKPSVRIASHKEANKEVGEIAVGFSAAATRYEPSNGLDAEGLLVASKEPLDKVEREHIRLGRHTQRTGDHKTSGGQTKQSGARDNQGRRATDN